MKSNKSGFDAKAAVQWLSTEIEKNATGPYGQPWKEPVLDLIASNTALAGAKSPDAFYKAVYALCNSMRDNKAFQKEPFGLAPLALWKIAKSAEERRATLGYGDDA
jgi:hypothetical protein